MSEYQILTDLKEVQKILEKNGFVWSVQVVGEVVALLEKFLFKKEAS